MKNVLIIIQIIALLLGGFSMNAQAADKNGKRSLLEKRLSEIIATDGEETIDSIYAMAAVADAYHEQGDFVQVVALREKISLLCKKTLGEHHPTTLIAMNNLAASYKGIGRYEEAVALYQQVLTLRTDTLGEENLSTLLSMNNLAVAFNALGHYQEARELQEKVVALRKKVLGEKHPDTLVSLNNLAFTYSKQGQYQKAIELEEKTFVVRSENLGEDHPDTITSMMNLADYYQHQGRNREALELNQKAVIFQRERLGENHPDTLSGMNNLASVYYQLGMLNQALVLNEKTFVLRSKVLGEDNPDTYKSMNNLAASYVSLGRYEEAVAFYLEIEKKYRESLGEKHPSTILSMHNLGVCYRALGKKEEALAINKKVFKLRLEVLGNRHPDTISSLNAWALSCSDLGQYQAAVLLTEQALILQTQLLGEKHPDTIRSRANLAFLYSRLGLQDKGLKINEQVFQLASQVLGEFHPDTLTSMMNLAEAYYANKQKQEAIAVAEKAIIGIEVLRLEEGLSLANRQTLFAKYIDSYKWLVQRYVEEKRLSEAFFVGELAKARTLLESSVAQYADESGILTDEENLKIKEYNIRLQDYTNQMAYANLLTTDEQFSQKVRLESARGQLQEELNAYRKNLMAKYPKYGQLNDVKILEAEAGMAMIPKDAVLISYLIRDYGEAGQITVFLLNPDFGLKAVNLKNIPRLESTVLAYRHALENKNIWLLTDGSYCASVGKPVDGVRGNVSAYEIGRYLGAKLLQPLQGEIADKRHWMIAGDGALSIIPFETLLVNGQAVLEKHDISYIQSLSMLNLLKERKREYEKLTNRKGLLAIGAAEYQGDGEKNSATFIKSDITRMLQGGYSKDIQRAAFQSLDLKWQELAASETELDYVGNIFGTDARIYKKAEASEENLLTLNRQNELSNYQYILFSTHGYFCVQEPGLSAVVLNQVHKNIDTDGYITAIKWPSYNLKSDLMVLSACETGLGRVIKGEGVSGLPFALYVAGNVNTIITLWSVFDESSGIFTKKLFEKIKAGKTELEALNETKREFMHSKDFSRPIYWAPYILYGI